MTRVAVVISLVASSVLTATSAGQVYQQQGQQQGSQQIQKHWSQTLIQDRDHDFGKVAKLSRQEHIFEFVNPFETDLYIDSVNASCLCTRPTVLTPVVKPGEKGQIKAAYDTRGFEGQRGATVRVRVRKSQPYHESTEIMLSVKGEIRRDVVVEPGEVNFGSLKAGAGGSATLLVKYAGNPNWTINEVRPSNDQFKVSVVETMRDPARKRVDYRITVSSSVDWPKGDINEQIVLMTNDPGIPTMSIPVSGRVRTGIEASDIRLGSLVEGKSVQRKLIVKGDSQFAITGIQSSTPNVQFQATDNVHRTVHMLDYAINTGKPGKIDGTIVLKTTDPDQPQLTLAVDADVVSSTFASDSEGIASDQSRKDK